MGDSNLVVLHISQREVSASSQPVARSLRATIDACVHALHQKPETSAEQASAVASFGSAAVQLYRWLIPSSVATLPSNSELLLVPDGQLQYLPFEALISSPNSSAQTFADFDYLAFEHQLHYGLSAAHLIDEAQHSQQPAQVLGVGLSFNTQAVTADATRAQLGALPYAEQELALLQQHTGATLVQNAAATVSAIHKAASGYDLLHIATHTLLNDTTPALSRMVLHPDSGNDGYLYAYQIQAMRLKAQLAVLSSCATGQGALLRGEGVQSMARSFAMAGCPSVVMSLWEVADEATYTLMSSFYEALANGQPAAKALNQAQQHVAHHPDHPEWANPHYWAPFVHLGPSSSFELPVQTPFWWWIVLFFVALLLAPVLYFLKRSARKHSIS